MLTSLKHIIFWTLSIYSIKTIGLETNSCFYEGTDENITIEKCKNIDGQYKFSAIYIRKIDTNSAYCSYWKQHLDEFGNIDKRYDPVLLVEENQKKSCNKLFDLSLKYTNVYTKDSERADFFDEYLTRSADLKNCLSKDACIKGFLKGYGIIKKYYYARASEIEDLHIFLNTEFFMESCHINYWDNNYYTYKLCNSDSCWGLDVEYRNEKFKLDDFRRIKVKLGSE